MSMPRTLVLGLLCGLSLSAATAQEIAYKSAVVALADSPELRATFEDGLVAKAREHRYDAVTSYDLVPDVGDVDNRRFVSTLAKEGIRAVLMLRPAAIGPNSSLESVRNEVPQTLYSDMRKFAKEVSASGSDDLIAVVHMAIYTIDSGQAQLISAGAVWLDEEVQSQEQGIERLQDLIVANVDAARPAIRGRLGLPPLRP
jgi:hypothetical protein